MFPLRLSSNLIVAGIALIGVVGLGWYLRHSGYQAGEAACQAHMQGLVDAATARSVQIETAAQARVNEQEKVNAEAYADLDVRYRAAVERLRTQPARSRPVPEAPVNAAERDGRGNGSGLPQPDASDPRPVLILYARDAERLRIALRACQQYGAEIERLRTDIP